MSGEEGRSEWGEMVLPGVYMIAGKVHVDKASAKKAPDYTEVYRRIDEVQGYIEKLEASQSYMREQLASMEADEEDVDDDCAQNVATLCLESSESAEGGHGGGSEADFLRDVMKENELAVQQKQRELSKLMEMIKMHTCSCSHAKEEGGLIMQGDGHTQGENIPAERQTRVRFAL